CRRACRGRGTGRASAGTDGGRASCSAGTSKARFRRSGMVPGPMRAPLALVLLSLAPAFAQSAATITEPGRSLARPLAMFLAGDASAERSLMLLLDPTASVQAAGLPDLFDQALAGARAD